MADISVSPKQGGLPTWLWALIAIVCVAGLMIWLAMQESSTPTLVVEEDTAAAVLVVDTVPVDTLGVDTTAQ